MPASSASNGSLAKIRQLCEQLIFGSSAGRRGLGPWIPLRLKMLIAIQMYATNCFFLVCADVAEVSHALVSRSVKTISRIIAQRNKISSNAKSQKCVVVSTEILRHVLLFKSDGTIDCTHIPISNPGGANAERFRCRKFFLTQY